MAERDSNPTQGFGATSQQLGDWSTEEEYWRQNWASRPYVISDRGFAFYRPGYRYGCESAQRLHGGKWEDVESDLRTGWDRYEHRGTSAWEHMRDAVRDGWNRMVRRK